MQKIYSVNLHLFISLKNLIILNVRKIFTILSVSFSLVATAQTELVFVFFKDKPNKSAFYNNPLSELTQNLWTEERSSEYLLQIRMRH